jgi:hypothetical protein
MQEVTDNDLAMAGRDLSLIRMIGRQDGLRLSPSWLSGTGKLAILSLSIAGCLTHAKCLWVRVLIVVSWWLASRCLVWVYVFRMEGLV